MSKCLKSTCNWTSDYGISLGFVPPPKGRNRAPVEPETRGAGGQSNRNQNPGRGGQAGRHHGDAACGL